MIEIASFLTLNDRVCRVVIAERTDTLAAQGFVLPELRAHAHGDRPVAIGFDQTISQPQAPVRQLAIGGRMVIPVGATDGPSASRCSREAPTARRAKRVDPLVQRKR
jgi:protein-L-isoaspartate O-methyltransferase